jgi:hypothetical protein
MKENRLSMDFFLIIDIFAECLYLASSKSVIWQVHRVIILPKYDVLGSIRMIAKMPS